MSLVVAALALCYSQCLRFSHAQYAMKDVPLNAQGIDVEDRIGNFIPTDLLFKDERGNRISLARFFKQSRPIVLTLNYSDCPGLCIAQLENLVSTLREIDDVGLGTKFEIVTVSIDPTETPVKAALTKQKYVEMLGVDSAKAGWHFLTGDQASISSLADAVGFRYTYDKPNKRYSHPAVTYFISSEGRICRYFLSLGTEPAQFRLAIADAAQGRLGASISDVIMQMCYLYNPNTNRYTAAAHRIMAVAWGSFTIMVIGCIAPFWFGKSGPKQTLNNQSSNAMSSREVSDEGASNVQMAADTEQVTTTVNPVGH